MTTTLTPPADAPLIDLDNLARLEAAATPGPWNIADTSSLPSSAFEVARVGRSAASLSIRAGEPGQDMMRAATGSVTADARFIASARNALPALLADHARLVTEVARLRGVIHDALDKWATTGDVDYAMGAMHKEAAGE